MTPWVLDTIKVLSALTVWGDIVIILWLISHAFLDPKKNPFMRIARFGAWGAFLVSLGATAGSIFLSWGAEFLPCSLCWWQRVFMFPLPIILALGIMKRDRGVGDYAITLAAPGAVVAAYHAYLQYGGTALASCAAISGGASCVTRLVYEFGYVTIPIMTLTAFGLIIVAMISAKIAATHQL